MKTSKLLRQMPIGTGCSRPWMELQPCVWSSDLDAGGHLDAPEMLPGGSTQRFIAYSRIYAASSLALRNSNPFARYAS